MAHRRSSIAVALVGVVALGLGSRLRFMPAFCIAYVGDVLWGTLFFALAAFVTPHAAARRLWLVSTAVTELIELSQLYQAPWAQAVRATRVGGLLLGHGFSWSDTVCVAVGTSAAALAYVVSAASMAKAPREPTALSPVARPRTPRSPHPQ